MLRRILPIGDPSLRRPARITSAFQGDLIALAGDMVETMRAHDGVGLAAPQVGVPTALIVIEVPEPADPESESTRLYILRDPVIEGLSEFEPMREGCLSLPGYFGYPNRAKRARVRALDLNGRPMRLEAEGLLAQALQHEIDHLRGILFTDRVGSLHLVRPETHSEPVPA
ncbi:MAG: peptide deformylase [Chloroflexi bacterium]|nr:peptide deformylase [Chloroflexota bacterium]